MSKTDDSSVDEKASNVDSCDDGTGGSFDDPSATATDPFRFSPAHQSETTGSQEDGSGLPVS